MFHFQCDLFFSLVIIGFFGMYYAEFYRMRYYVHSFTHAHLAELKTNSADKCYNLTNLPCHLQTSINFYFLLVEYLVVYYFSIVIGIIYTWHRTIRLLSCLFTIFVITIIICGTDLILYFDQIVVNSFTVCLSLFFTFIKLEVCIPHMVDDPLSVLCRKTASSTDLYEYLLTDHSKRARFYRWAKKMKKQWDIREEKFIITIIASLIICFCVTIAVIGGYPYFL